MGGVLVVGDALRICSITRASNSSDVIASPSRRKLSTQRAFSAGLFCRTLSGLAAQAKILSALRACGLASAARSTVADYLNQDGRDRKKYSWLLSVESAGSAARVRFWPYAAPECQY